MIKSTKMKRIVTIVIDDPKDLIESDEHAAEVVKRVLVIGYDKTASYCKFKVIGGPTA